MAVVRLPWTSPPLSLNSREHWAHKARVTQQVRTTTAWLCNGLGRANRVRVTLTYIPRDSRRRDADNLVATYKPICDGIVDAGVVTDDDPLHMVKVMPHIAPADPNDPRMELTIEVLAHDWSESQGAASRELLQSNANRRVNRIGITTNVTKEPSR